MRWITLFITGCLLIAVALDVRDHPTPESADPYHARMLALTNAAASSLQRLQGWTIEKQRVPPEAKKLLKPNVAEAWRCTQATTGIRATLILVQTKDAGDMGGHYPPVCYPAHGWTDVSENGSSKTIVVRGTPIQTGVYSFKQGRIDDERIVRIYNFFAIPNKGLVSSIQDVRRASEDYRIRPFGAAQVQVMVSSEMSEENTNVVFQDLVGELMPLIQALGEGMQGSGV